MVENNIRYLCYIYITLYNVYNISLHKYFRKDKTLFWSRRVFDCLQFLSKTFNKLSRDTIVLHSYRLFLQFCFPERSVYVDFRAKLTIAITQHMVASMNACKLVANLAISCVSSAICFKRGIALNSLLYTLPLLPLCSLVYYLIVLYLLLRFSKCFLKTFICQPWWKRHVALWEIN